MCAHTRTHSIRVLKKKKAVESCASVSHNTVVLGAEGAFSGLLLCVCFLIRKLLSCGVRECVFRTHEHRIHSLKSGESCVFVSHNAVVLGAEGAFLYFCVLFDPQSVELRLTCVCDQHECRWSSGAILVLVYDFPSAANVWCVAC